MMRLFTTSLWITSPFLLGAAAAAASAATTITSSTNFVFSTIPSSATSLDAAVRINEKAGEEGVAEVVGVKNAPPLRRQRRRQVKEVTTTATKAKKDEKLLEPPRDPEQEDKDFWARMLTDEMGSIPAPKPTDPPAPAPCPVVVEVDCVSIDGSQSCADIDPPASGAGDDCVVEVEYSYTFTNTGSEIQRIYSLEITRHDHVTTDITDTFPVTDIAPGSSVIIFENAQIDICQPQDEDEAFATDAAFVTGPPCDVEVVIACESDDGDECRELPQADSPEECLIDITYTYTVTNIGDVDANIILFTRTRNGEFRDLIDLLDDPFLAVADDTAVTETEQIDRCVQQSFATNTIVAQIPNADLLCEDIGHYP